MSKDEQIIFERIKNKQCPICGKETPSGKATLVIDAKFGEVFVCGHHIVQGTDKIQE